MRFVSRPPVCSLLLSASLTTGPPLLAQPAPEAPGERPASDFDELLEPEPEPPGEPAPGPPPTPPTATAPSPESPPPTPTQDAGSAEDFQAIEAAMARDQAAAEAQPSAARSSSGAVQSLNPDLSVIADFALAAFSEDENHQTGGHDPTENGFNLQQVELSLSAPVDPYLRFDSHLVFSLFGVEVEEAYATTLDLFPGLQARFGQMLTRFGRLNPTHPHTWEFVDQPFAVGRVFGSEGNRGVGVELSYLTPLPWYVELVGSVTPADGEATARSFYGAQGPGVEAPRDLLYVTAIKQFFPLADDWSLSLGTSGAFGPNASGRENRSEVYGADLYLKYRPISRQSVSMLALQAEWLYRRRQIPEDVLQDFSGYAQVVYHFAQRFSVAGRYESGTPARNQDGAVAPDPLDPEWTQLRTRWSLSLTHYPTEFSRFRLQGSRDAGFEHPVWAGFLAAEVVVGAHGAHTF